MFRSAPIAVLLSATLANAAPNEDHWGSPPSVDYGRAADLVASKRYDEALTILTDLADKTPGDANVFNLLGFSYRKTGDLDRAEANYQRALRLNPDHRGALEYQGELFLSRNNLASAEANLARLAALCPAGCAEREDLAKAVADWKAAQN